MVPGMSGSRSRRFSHVLRRRQGYPPRALYKLLVAGYEQNDLLFCSKYNPRMVVQYERNGTGPVGI
jgi:hypothetical protein